MNHRILTLADVIINPSDLLAAQKQYMDSRYRENLIMFGAIALAIVIGSIWAILYSKKKKKRRHHFQERAEKVILHEDEEAESDKSRSRRKWRKPRRPHRPLNPTLAQTHGLPPVRDPNSPLPPMP